MNLLFDEELKLCLSPTLETTIGPVEFDDVLPVFGKDCVITHLYFLLEVAALELTLSDFQSLVVDAYSSVGGWLRHQFVSILDESLQDLCIVCLL